MGETRAALNRILAKLDRVPDSDSVVVLKSDLRAVLGALTELVKPESSRLPRVWREGDDEPDDVEVVSDDEGDEWRPIGDSTWRLVTDPNDTRNYVVHGDYLLAWYALVSAHGELREVIR